MQFLRCSCENTENIMLLSLFVMWGSWVWGFSKVWRHLIPCIGLHTIPYYGYSHTIYRCIQPPQEPWALTVWYGNMAVFMDKFMSHDQPISICLPILTPKQVFRAVLTGMVVKLILADIGQASMLLTKKERQDRGMKTLYWFCTYIIIIQHARRRLLKWPRIATSFGCCFHPIPHGRDESWLL